MPVIRWIVNASTGKELCVLSRSFPFILALYPPPGVFVPAIMPQAGTPVLVESCFQLEEHPHHGTS